MDSHLENGSQIIEVKCPRADTPQGRARIRPDGLIMEIERHSPRPYYLFVKDAFMGTVSDDAPPRIKKLVIEIRHLFVHIITLCACLSEMTAPTPEDRELLRCTLPSESRHRL
jgi:hypothetical protein